MHTRAKVRALHSNSHELRRRKHAWNYKAPHLHLHEQPSAQHLQGSVASEICQMSNAQAHCSTSYECMWRLYPACSLVQLLCICRQQPLESAAQCHQRCTTTHVLHTAGEGSPNPARHTRMHNFKRGTLMTTREGMHMRDTRQDSWHAQTA